MYNPYYIITMQKSGGKLRPGGISPPPYETLIGLGQVTPNYMGVLSYSVCDRVVKADKSGM